MTMLYRHFDKRRRLLYVGISEDALKRAAQHGVKPWGHLIVRVTIEHFDTRALAEEAEKAAILSESPMFNIVHARQRQLPIGEKDQKPTLRLPAAKATVELDLARHMADAERLILERALALYGGNRTMAGRRIGLSLRQMRYRMDKLGVTA